MEGEPPTNASTPAGAVFLSYASQDAESAKRICDALRAAGIEVWFDQSELRGGDAWDQSIRRQIKTCALFIPVVSRHTHERAEGYFRLEWKLAVDRSHLIMANKAFLLPVVIDDTRDDDENVPDKFREVQWTRLPGGETPPTFVEQAKRMLSAESSPTAHPGRGASSAVVSVAMASRRLMAWRSGALYAAIAAGVLLALGYFERERLNQPKPSVPGAPSIAVLPFSDLSPGGDQGYFSDGVAEEILNVLAHVSGLKVASRTSSFRFRNSELGLPEIARALGVRHVLEGSVRKAGDAVRITAKLIDATTDQDVWSQDFDRPLTTANLFAIQDEIATEIVQHLAVTIGPANVGKPAQQETSTASFDVYDLYLRGHALFLARTKSNLTEAARLLKTAVAKDPKFARAWETLAAVLAISPFYGLNEEADYNQAGLQAANSALALDHSLSLAYAVRGLVQRNRLLLGMPGSWNQTLGDFTEAIARDPKNATAFLWRGIGNEILGYFDSAGEDLQHCLDLDPAYEVCRRHLALAELCKGRTELALRLYEVGLAQADVNVDVYFARAVAARGDNIATLAVLQQQFRAEPPLLQALFRALTDPAFSTKERQEALALVSEKREDPDATMGALWVLKGYDQIANLLTDSPVVWIPGDSDWLGSAARKRMIERWQLPEYWRTHGFPPQCKPVARADFACR